MATLKQMFGIKGRPIAKIYFRNANEEWTKYVYSKKAIERLSKSKYFMSIRLY